MILHFSTVHYRDDSRILSKQLRSLAKRYGGRPRLFVQDGKGDASDEVNGVEIVDTGPRRARLARMTVGAWQMIRAVVRAKPAVAHFHDPELLPWAALLRLWGIKVVYDVHEDYPEAVAHNYRLPALARHLLPPIVRFVEWGGAQLMSGVVAATPEIGARFPKSKTALVRNFPIVDELIGPTGVRMADRPVEFAYVGTITQNRNIVGMLDAIGLLDDDRARLRLAGDFPVAADEQIARAHPGWRRVTFDGWISRAEVAGILAGARAGLVLIKPVAHEMVGLPIKLFEYMAAGIPVLASDFPVWRSIIGEARCGLLVDPLQPVQIAEAMRWMIDHPAEAEEMGARGREAVLAVYNWTGEAESLYKLYDQWIMRADRASA